MIYHAWLKRIWRMHIPAWWSSKGSPWILYQEKEKSGKWGGNSKLGDLATIQKLYRGRWDYNEEETIKILAEQTYTIRNMEGRRKNRKLRKQNKIQKRNEEKTWRKNTKKTADGR